MSFIELIILNIAIGLAQMLLPPAHPSPPPTHIEEQE